MTRTCAIYESTCLPHDICSIIAGYAPGLSRAALDKTIVMIRSKYDKTTPADRDVYIARITSTDLIRIASYKEHRGWDGVRVNINKLYWLLHSRKLRRPTFKIENFDECLCIIEDLFHKNIQLV